jgi:hypothetical protein
MDPREKEEAEEHTCGFTQEEIEAAPPVDLEDPEDDD